MREALGCAIVLMLTAALVAFMGVGRLFRDHWLFILRHYGLAILLFATVVTVEMALALEPAFRGYRNLRVMGSKLDMAQAELEEKGVI